MIIAWLMIPGVCSFAQEQEVEQMPYFRGCSDVKDLVAKRKCSNEKLIRYLQAAIEYPETARKEKVEGTVYLSFVVNTEGRVQEVEVLRGIGGGCDETAVAMLSEMPIWEPASKEGMPVAVKMNLPIQFSLGDEDASTIDQYRIIWSSVSDRESLTRDEVLSNIDQPITLLDADGNKVNFNDLTFIRGKGEKFKIASSSGNITAQMRKLCKKLKKGNTFSIVATIQVDGSFDYVEKEWLIQE